MKNLEAYHDYLPSIKNMPTVSHDQREVLTNTLDDKTKCKLSFIAQLRRNEGLRTGAPLKNKCGFYKINFLLKKYSLRDFTKGRTYISTQILLYEKLIGNLGKEYRSLSRETVLFFHVKRVY